MAKDAFTKEWITRNSIEIVSRYNDGVLTLRSLHYQLVGIGMTNDIQHYKRVVSAMIDARWDGLINFEKFSDLDRQMEGSTKYEETSVEKEVAQAKRVIHAWMTYYNKNRWENQPIYPEVFIEKKALQGVFDSICRRWAVALGACKGYPSLTFLNESAQRFKAAQEAGKQCVILYFGDYDPSGEDIPRAIQENLRKLGAEVEVRRLALMEDQVIAWKLPPAPAKLTDTRTAKWEGLGQVELDAVKPEKLQFMCTEAIKSVMDETLYAQLKETEAEETKEYVKTLKMYVQEMQIDMEDEE